MSTTTDALPIRALRSHVRFLEDAVDTWREGPEKALQLFPAPEVVRLGVTAGQIACLLWDQLGFADAVGVPISAERRGEMRRFLQVTHQTLERLCAMGRDLGSGDDFAPLEDVAAQVADRHAEAELGLPWDEGAAPQVDREAARSGKEAARAGRIRDLEDVIHDLQARN